MLGLTSRWRLGALLGCLSAVGCAGTIDDLTSANYRSRLFQHPINTLFVTPEPLGVLRDSTDGNERAKAMKRLREPLVHGGTQAEQDQILQIVADAAARDKQPLCRLAAIEKLGTFRDPRAAGALISAYESLAPIHDTKDDPDRLLARRSVRPDSITFPTVTINLVQCRTLVALGQTKQPEAARFLQGIAQTPPPNERDDLELSQHRERTLAALRALGNFHDEQTAATLVRALQSQQSEKDGTVRVRDVALRDRAHESLQACTGKNLPADLASWEAVVQVPSAPAAAPGVPAASTPVQTAEHQQPAR